MSRDNNGIFTPPPGTTVSTGDTLLISQYNPFVEDVSQALTGSLSRDGLGAMRAPLNAGGYRVQNIAQGVAPTDAVRMDQLSGGQVFPSVGIAVSTGTEWATSIPMPAGGLVGVTATQTLTNKTFGSGTTFTAPTISNGTATGTTLISCTIRANTTVNDTGTISPSSVGYRGVPLITATTRTLGLTDAGKVIHASGNVTIPANSSVAFPIGTVIAISNSSATNSTISITGDTLRFGTLTGSRTLLPYRVAGLMKTGATEWKIEGGIS